MRHKTLAAVVLLASLQLPARASGPEPFNEAMLKGFSYRTLGPYRAGSWISDIAVPDAPQKAHLYTFYVAVRYGGVWKTTNNGTTFEPVFDGQDAVGIGCLAIAPSNANIVWVGSGDAASVRVAYPGNGVYKSTDAGKTWQRMGLSGSHHIARIVIHPANPDVVYVAAMGHLWSTNEERGVFKTSDGGKTWRKVLYVNESTGVIDLVINRSHPDTLYAAAYDVQRRPWRLLEGGPGSGIHRTSDGGKTWKRLGGGLPAGPLGRIGLDLYQKNPKIVYAVLENLAKRPPTEDEAKRDRERTIEPRERTIGGEVYRTDDGGQSWRKMNSANDDVSSKAGYSFNQIRVDQNDDRRIIINSDSLLSSRDAGKTWTGLTWDSRDLFSKAFGDFRTMWIDPQDSDRMILGSDGGVHVSYDGGRTCDHYTNLPGGEFYAVGVDMEDPYRIYGGLQDHESWRGPINGPSGYVSLEDWVTVGEGDGMYNQVDPTDSRWVYNTSEWGNHYRVDQKLHVRTRIAPTRPPGQPPLRFNWVPPIRLSPHNSQILYAGAQVLLRSLDRGDHWEEISPDLTTNDQSKVSPPGSSVQFCTITTIAESPVKAGTIWVGTDDGKVHFTTNHGAAWTDVTAKIAAAGGPEDWWVTRVLASGFAPGTAYVTKSGRRFDRMEPMVFKTTDFGATWKALAADLPERAVDVIVEDSQDPDILFVGASLGVFVSIDGGGHWVALKGNMPAVPVTDLVVHPREHDLIVATYGRGLYVANVAWIGEVKKGALDEDVHLFAVRPKKPRTEGAWGNYDLYGDRFLRTPNEPNGLVFDYYLKQKASEKAILTVADAAGQVVRTIEGTGNAGFNRAVCEFQPAGVGPGRGKGRPLSPGEYQVTLQVGGKKVSQKAQVLPQ